MARSWDRLVAVVAVSIGDVIIAKGWPLEVKNVTGMPRWAASSMTSVEMLTPRGGKTSSPMRKNGISSSTRFGRLGRSTGSAVVSAAADPGSFRGSGWRITSRSPRLPSDVPKLRMMIVRNMPPNPLDSVAYFDTAAPTFWSRVGRHGPRGSDALALAAGSSVNRRCEPLSQRDRAPPARPAIGSQERRPFRRGRDSAQQPHSTASARPGRRTRTR